MLTGSKIKLQSDRQGVLAFWLRKDGREKGEEGGRGGGREGRKVNHLYMLRNLRNQETHRRVRGKVSLEKRDGRRDLINFIFVYLCIFLVSLIVYYFFN